MDRLESVMPFTYHSRPTRRAEGDIRVGVAEPWVH